MKPHLCFLTLVVFIFSCHERNGRKATTPPSRDTIKPVAGLVADDTDEVGYPIKYIEQARLDKPNQVIELISSFAIVNGQVDRECHYDASSAYFVYIDKKTGKTDTVKSGLDNAEGCSDCVIRDMTDSFRLNKLIVQVITPAEDIYYYSTFLTCENGKLKELFSLMDTRETGVPLHREGSKLVGFMAGRDEVVENLEFDYPVEIDTKTFEVTNILPVKQSIDWRTRATAGFRAHRVVNGQVDSSLVVVKAGTAVTVDTLYRNLGKVRIRVGDSVEVEIKAETAEQKLGHNAAG